MTTGLTKDEEEAIFKKKLSYDGHGLGDDKKLIVIAKNVTKLCLCDEMTDDEASKLSHTITKDLSIAAAAAAKHNKMLQMCSRSFAEIESELATRAEEYEELKEKYARSKHRLELIKRLQQINILPSCKKTEILMAQTELKKRKLLTKIENQKENLNILMEACKNLQTVYNSIE